jgi:hypothetical protein
MSSSELRERLLSSIGMTQASEELQEGFLHAFERITLRRLGCMVAGMLNDEQKERVRQMRQTGLPDSDVLTWIKSQMRLSYDDLHEAILLAVVREVEDAQTRRGARDKTKFRL